MFKLLRKYNKILLSIFGVLLMITFLIPQAISRFSEQTGSSGAVVATVGERETVTASTWARVQAETKFIQDMGGMAGLGTTRQLAPEHWYLLTREAEAAGLVGAGTSDGYIAQMVASSGRADEDFARRLEGRIIGVNLLMQLYQGGGASSDTRLRHVARKLLDQAVAQIVVLEAKPDETIQPTEEEIQAQFAKYADVAPGTGKDGFGYKLPDRVKLEWLHVPIDAVRAVARTSDQFSSVAQRLHWKKNENNAAKGFPKAEGGAIPEVVRNDLLEQLTREKVDEIAKSAADQLRMNRRGIPEKDGYVVLPEDWEQRQLAFTQLAGDIQAKFGVELPSYHAEGDWIAVSDVAAIEGLGTATSDRFGSAPVGAASLIESTRELRVEDKDKPASTAFIQKDVAGPPLKGADGSLYLFRIVDASPSHTPASVDDVRAAVVADLQKSAEYQRLAEMVEDIEREAESKGMVPFALAHDTIVQPTMTLSVANRFILNYLAQNNQPMMVTPTEFPVIRQHRDTLEKVLEYAASLGTDKPVDQLPEDQRIAVFAVPEKRAVLVIRLMQFNPMTQEDFSELVQQQIAQRLLAIDDSEESGGLQDAFGLEAMKKRHNFAFSQDGSAESAPESAAASAG